MVASKRPARKTWSIGLAGLLVVAATSIYRAFYPPLPSYIKLPPDNSVQVSRRFYTFMWGPKYYCRVHSPLAAWQTASYIEKSLVGWKNILAVSQLDKWSDDMNGWALKRTGHFVSVWYEPDEIQDEGTEVYSMMRVWPEPNGSTIEFYYATGF